MQLGALIRLLNSTSLLNHSMEKVYQALSVEQLLKAIEVAVCPTWYDKKPVYYRDNNQFKSHECPTPGNTFDVAIKSIANDVKEASRGLSITNYAKSATESK